MRFPWFKIVALIVLIVGGLWVAMTMDMGPCRCRTPAGGDGSAPAASDSPAATRPADATGLPRLLDLGSKSCTPCKMMAPVLEDLRRSHADQFVTEFVDVGRDPQAGRQYRIAAIPTQIFFDASGRELFRHEGFMSRQAILDKWRELGVDVRD